MILVKQATLVPENDSKLGFANACRLFQHRLEHWFQLSGRRTDDLEHVGGGSLLLERFTQLAKQPRVLDGNDGLGGKILN